MKNRLDDEKICLEHMGVWSDTHPAGRSRRNSETFLLHLTTVLGWHLGQVLTAPQSPKPEIRWRPTADLAHFGSDSGRATISKDNGLGRKILEKGNGDFLSLPWGRQRETTSALFPNIVPWLCTEARRKRKTLTGLPKVLTPRSVGEEVKPCRSSSCKILTRTYLKWQSEMWEQWQDLRN